MKTQMFNRFLSGFLSLLLLSTSILGQTAFGPSTFVSPPAQPVTNSQSLRSALGRRPRLSFVRKIGGVAFDGKAMPAENLKVNSIAVNYSPLKADGQRLSVTINGQTVEAPIYDWQLIPIAEFANSKSTACFTLFGTLQDSKQQKSFVEKGGMILNYHESFVDTLMGLRLFQLDALLVAPYSYELPKEQGRYLLGPGEIAPDIEANKQARDAFENYLKGLGEKYRSYVISDFRRHTTFKVQDGQLSISGEPSYYFWKMDEEALRGLFTGEATTTARQVLNAQYKKAKERDPYLSLPEWLVQRLLLEAARYDQEIGDYRLLAGNQNLLQLLGTRNSAERESLLRSQTTALLYSQLEELSTLVNAIRAQEVTTLSEKVSDQTEMLRTINPTVWDAGTTVMRYAAFFRYCKTKNPKQWRRFMNQIKRAPSPHPSVTTPTVWLDPTVAERNS